MTLRGGHFSWRSLKKTQKKKEIGAVSLQSPVPQILRKVKSRKICQFFWGGCCWGFTSLHVGFRKPNENELQVFFPFLFFFFASGFNSNSATVARIRTWIWPGKKIKRKRKRKQQLRRHPKTFEVEIFFDRRSSGGPFHSISIGNGRQMAKSGPVLSMDRKNANNTFSIDDINWK